MLTRFGSLGLAGYMSVCDGLHPASLPDHKLLTGRFAEGRNDDMKGELTPATNCSGIVHEQWAAQQRASKQKT